MNLAYRVAAFVLILLGGAIATGQVPDQSNLRGDSAQTRKRLAEAEQKLIAGKTADATDDLQRVLDEAGDDLITIDGKQYRAARWVAHGILTKLPPDALRSYQDRIDDPARKLLDAGKRTREPAPLWQLLDRYYVSRPANEAILLLGDLLFERGEFRAAERLWRQLLPDAGADIVYPKSKVDPAIVRARLVLAAIFQGDTDRARTELTALNKKHPGAKGPLAGKDGRLDDTLRAFLDNPPRLPLAANAGKNWPTFGGGPDRSARVANIPRDLPHQPTWKNDISAATVVRHHELPFGPPGRPPFGNPVIVSGQVFVSDGWEVYGIDLLTGKLADSIELFERPKGLKTPDPSPTLMSAGNRLYARAGPGAVKPGEATAIVCIALTTRVDGTPALKELWRLKPPVAEGKLSVVWEGAPLVDGRRLWAAYARFEGGRVVHGIACYDPADPASAPEHPAWITDVCDCQIPVIKDAASVEGRSRHELLTLAGRNVVFCSNAGSVVALDAETGRRAWGFRYPRGRKADANRSADPAPAIAVGGRVFVAPTDADRIYALDSETGQSVWPSSGLTEGANIVGVSSGRLIVAVAGPVRGVRGLSLANGSYLEPEGWLPHNGGGFLGYGRGFVSDDAIVWPTQGGLYILGSHNGLPVADGQARDSGNAVYADGVLVVVTPTQVLGYVSETKRFGPPNPRSERERFEKQVGAAENALAMGETATARALLLDVARSDSAKPYRAWAAARLLLLTPKTDAESKLPADLRAAIAAELLDEWLIPPDGVPATLGALLDRHLGHKSVSAFLSSSSALLRERKSDGAPTLSPEAEIVGTTKLRTGTSPMLWIPGMVAPPKRLFVTTATEVSAISLTDRGVSRHGTADRFTHAADINEGFVTAGPLVVAVYGNDHSPLWVFRVPTTDPLPAQPGEFRPYPHNFTSTAELSSFRLIGSWLFARLGERHLIALDLRGKRVAWVLGTSGKPGFRPVAFPDAARFGSEFAATGRFVVVQLSDGRRWFVQAETGKRLEIPGFGEQTTRVWWPQAPVEVESNVLPMADGPGLVRMLNLATGKVKWTHQEEGEASLSGEPPQIRVWGDVLLIAVRRNHGVELNRLDVDDGKSAWQSGAVFLDADRVNLTNADADADRLYVPVGNALSAFTLKAGKSAWEVELPDNCRACGWVVRAGQKCVIVYPELAIPREPVADVFDRVVRSFRAEPALWRLPGLAAGLYDAWVARTVPVLLLDPDTGKQLGKFEIPAAGPAIVTWFEHDLAAIATGNRVVWLR